MNIPEKIVKGRYTYKYLKKVNDRLYLYEEEKYGWKECFLITDLIQMEDMKEKNNRGLPRRGKKLI